MTVQDARRSIRIAVLAMGGEGGGVLGDWLVELAEHNGYVAQMTSVPGVAQRTGATLYYIEMFPAAAVPAGAAPVLAQMPAPGDVDIVLASELMEAGRAIQRGIVTPDRTTLLASTHRVFSMTERIAMTDGRVDEAALLSACRTAAQKFIGFDMMALAEKNGSVISAVLFGALAGAKALPFGREAFEETIRKGGIGVATSLRAFGAAYDAGRGELIMPDAVAAPRAATTPAPAASLDPVDAFPMEARDLVRAGIAQCRDWQDQSYANLYLERLRPVLETDRSHGDGSFALTAETARQLALAMTYEDTIRVADLKIRASRFARVEQEAGVKPGQLLEIREYLHPRLQEIAETVPAGLGRFLLKPGWAHNVVQRFTSDGKVLETTSIRGFLMLYILAGMRRWRRSNMRHAAEEKSIAAWLDLVRATAARDYPLSVEVAALRSIVKGYSDTHARGYANFNRIVALVPELRGPGSAKRLAALRQAANADEQGEALAKALEAQGLAA